MPLSSLIPRHGGRLAAIALAALAMLLGTAAARAQSTATASTLGEQRTAVILVNFADNPAEPQTPAQAHALVLGQVGDFFWEASYQKAFLSGDTFGWFTLPVTSSACTTDAIVKEGNRAASRAGANLSSYAHFVYLFPTASGCTQGGSAQIGPAGEKRVFINGAAGFALRPIAHEMGHGFGLSHANGLDCDGGAIAGTCTILNYGDSSDGMGGEGHFNAFHKERLGWLNAPGAPGITTVTSSGRYAIAPYETPGQDSKALKILKDTDPATGRKTWYYLEYRQPLGFDAGLARYGNLTDGVQVRTGFDHGGDNESLLLDMTPGSQYYDFDDAALEAGSRYVDGTAGVAFTVVSSDSSGAIIDVEVDSATAPPASCVRAAPTLTLAGPATAMAPGSTASYTAGLVNRDSSACAATTFNLAGAVPSGWTMSLAAASLSLSPGATASTTLVVTSPASAASGDYGIGLGSSSPVGSTHATNASAIYTVAAGSQGTLTSAVGTDQAVYSRGQTVYLSALVRRNGVVVQGASVRFTVALPNGSTDELVATSGNDGYARASYKLGKGKPAIGDYQVAAQANSGGSSATAGTGFSVR